MSQLTTKQKQQEKEKLPFVILVKEKKDILFGKFDNAKEITKDSKKLAWQSILSQLEAMEINVIPHGKDWTYLRDVLWRNLVAAAKKRFDVKRRTGEGKVELTPLEMEILDVIGIDSPWHSSKDMV